MSKRSSSPLDALLDSSSASGPGGTSATAGAALDLPILAKRTRSAAAAAAAGGPTPSASAAAAGAPLPFPVGVTFSTKDSAQQLGYSMGGLEVAGVVGGYRMARATDGVFSGNWYWEAEILADEEEEEAAKDGGEREGEEQEEDGDGPREGEGAPQGQGKGNDDGGTSAPHFRLGWALRQADTQAPCGYDKNSYAYRDVDGAKVHKSLREDGYGEPYGPGDVIGFGICLPILPEHMQELSALNGGVLPSYVRGAEDDSTRAVGGAAEAASGAGADGGGPKQEAGGPGQEAQEAWRKELEALGNHIRFFKNGKDQGPAYQQLIGAKYYPSVSLYMGGKVRANFGPSWICDPGAMQGSSCRVDFRPISALKEPLKKEELAAYTAFIEGRRAAWRARRAGEEGKGEGVVEQGEGSITPE